MTDLRDLLDSVAGEPGLPTPDVVEADARRGRRALLRRRSGRTSAVAVLAAAVAVGVAVVPSLGRDGATQTVAPASQDAPNPGVDLVAYDGPLSGAAFRPAEIPTGWSVGGDDFVLLVAPPGQQPSTASAFIGKIAVYLDSGVPNESLPTGTTVPVGDRTGYVIDADPSALQVYVRRPDGSALRAQAPLDLHWDAATLGRFLAGVTVLDGAQASKG